MRLLFINRYFYPDISATSQLLTELTEDLSAKGDIVTVITGNMPYLADGARFPARETHEGIRIIRVGFTRFGRSRILGRLGDYLSFWISALWAAVRTDDQDCVVVLSDPPLLSVLALIVKSVKPVRTVCWLQDVFPEIAIRAGVLRQGMAARFLRAFTRWSLRRIDQIVVIGRCMERHLLSQGFPAETIVNISNWADGGLIRPVPQGENAFLKQHNLHNRFVVMYSGNHGVVHEYDTLVSVMRETQTIPGICYCFVGEGAWKHQLMETAKSEGWQHALFLPYQPKALLQSSLSAADVHLVSLRSDMAGLSVPSKLYGILAAARPVLFIGPKNSEVATIVQEADCGFNVEPECTEEAVRALHAWSHDRALREKQGTAGRRYFESHFDRPIATERFNQLLQRLVMDPSAQPMPIRTIAPPTRSQ